MKIWIGAWKRELPDHTVESVPLIGWAGLKNGELLKPAESLFDIFITMDSNLRYERKISNYKIAVIVLRARSNRLSDTRPLIPRVISLINNVRPGTLTKVSE